jgi:hypothetical protein
VETEKKLKSFEATMVPLRRSCLLISENTIITPQKQQTVQPGDAFEDTAFKPGFKIVKF